jgi:hypothetical protein
MSVAEMLIMSVAEMKMRILTLGGGSTNSLAGAEDETKALKISFVAASPSSRSLIRVCCSRTNPALRSR